MWNIVRYFRFQTMRCGKLRHFNGLKSLSKAKVVNKTNTKCLVYMYRNFDLSNSVGINRTRVCILLCKSDIAGVFLAFFHISWDTPLKISETGCIRWESKQTQKKIRRRKTEEGLIKPPEKVLLNVSWLYIVGTPTLGGRGKGSIFQK